MMLIIEPRFVFGKLRIRFGFAAIALLLAAGLGCGTANSKPTKTTKSGTGQAVPVAVAKAVRQDLPVYLIGLGTVTAYNTVSVRSRVDGQLVHVLFKEGQMVQKGDPLLDIDARPYVAALSQAMGQLTRDQAVLNEARIDLERYRAAFAKNAIARQQLDDQEQIVLQDQGTVMNDEGVIQNVKVNLAYCHIMAPISGRIGLRLVDEGNIVHASDPNPMLIITQVQPIFVIFTLPEDNLPAVAARKAQGTLRVDAYSRDDQRKLGSGTLGTIDNQIDQATGTIRLKAEFANDDGLLWPNQFVNAKLLLETRKDATLIPASAVQRGPDGAFVYVVKKDHSVDVRAVSIGITQNALAAVQDGVSEGETIVTDGQDRLQADSKVEIRNEGGESRRAVSAKAEAK